MLVYQQIGGNFCLNDDEPAFPDKCARHLWNGVNHYQVLRGSFCVSGTSQGLEGRKEDAAHIVEETNLRNAKNKVKKRNCEIKENADR